MSYMMRILNSINTHDSHFSKLYFCRGDFLMKKFILLLLVSASFLFARDNPFKPIVSNKSLGKATNIKTNLKPLIMEKFKLPSPVRVIKKISFKVLNVDGSISNLSFNVNKKVNWHNDIILSNYKIKIEKKATKIEPKLIKLFKFLSILVNGKQLLIKTKDSMIRELFFAKPYKIAIDFKRNVVFYTKFIKLKNLPFKEIVLGNHGNFYRIVLDLDGEYRYKIKKNSNGYLVELF